MRIASKRQRAESLRPPLAYAADLLRVCLRDKAIAASLIACQALLLLPMIVGFPMNEEAINRDRALSMLGIVRNELSAYKDEFPEELYDLTQQQYRHYSDAVAAKYPSKEFFRAMAAASEVEDAEQRAGYLTGDNIHSVYAKLFDGLASIDGTPVYATAADLPALEYLSFALGLMPAIVVLLPAVVATTSIVRRLRGQTLLANAPIGRAARRAVATMASIACAAAGLAAVLMPAALVALLRNGIGDPAYPPCPHNCRRRRRELCGPGNRGGHRPSCPGGHRPRIRHVRCWQGRSDWGVRRRRRAMCASPATPLLRQLGTVGRIRGMASHHLPQA